MIVQAKQLTDFNELLLTLKNQYSNHEVYILHSIPRKSIIVQQSAFIGAQITLSDDQMMVDACCPNLFLSALLGFLSGNFTALYEIRNEYYKFLEKGIQLTIFCSCAQEIRSLFN